MRVRYNSAGFRDSEHENPSPEAKRIVVLGDSYMEANMVPLGEVFHEQLERLLENDGRKADIWNLGVAGYGTLQEYLVFRKSGAPLKPEVVLLAFYLHNDVLNNAHHLNAAAMETRAGKRKRPYLDEGDESEFRALPPDYDEMRKTFERRRNSVFFRIKHNSVLWSFLRNARRAFEPSRETLSGGVLAMHMCNGAAGDEKAWRTTERILVRLKKEVAQTGAKLVVFSVPAIFDADTSIVKGLEEEGGTAAPKFCLETSPGYAKLRAVLESIGIDYVDLVPAFRETVSDEGQDLFVRGDWHWNGKGRALAARSVYDALKAKGLLAE